MSEIEFVRTVAIYVADQERSIRFFTEVLGLEVKSDIAMGPGGRWVQVAPPGAQTQLVIFPRAMMPNWSELKASIVFKCADTHRATEELKAKGVKFVMDPTKMLWGTFATFEDIDGNQFFLVDTPQP
ncbi:MAG: VOC family protein [Beijerinckiaceae bacterium]